MREAFEGQSRDECALFGVCGGDLCCCLGCSGVCLDVL